jgi:hypothetical protein
MRNTLVSLTLLIILGCKPEAKKSETGEVSDFTAFYERFHQDSAFQMEHILFPLQGLPSSADSAQLLDRNFRWQAEDWAIHRPIPANSDFSSKLLPVDEALVIEQIIHNSGDYAIERRFAKMNDEWLLIYYAGLNRVKSAE